MGEGSIRVLVVDDHESWRRFALRMIQGLSNSEVVGEASDGLQAIRLAQELQPDLIVLDIGLPQLNGIEAAREIRLLSPKSKVLFMSENRSSEIAKEALRMGGLGYVVKSAAASELLPAVQAVLHCKRFVSACFADVSLMDLSNDLKSATPSKTQDIHHHEVGFYSDSRHFLEEGTRFIGTALKAGNPGIVIATESHRNQLLPRLQAFDLNVEEAMKQGLYIPVDVVDALSTFMVSDTPDPIRFMRAFGGLIHKASESVEGDRRIAIFGEGVQILLEQSNPNAAIQVEKLCNQLVKQYNVDILCGYSRFPAEAELHNEPIVQQVCAEHSAVYSW